MSGSRDRHRTHGGGKVMAPRVAKISSPKGMPLTCACWLCETAGRGPSSLKRPVLVAFFALILWATLAVELRAAQVSPDATIALPATNHYAANILGGISNQGRTKRQPYVTAGDRT